MRYASLGEIPQKRHVQFRDPEAQSGNGKAPLLVEEVLGFEGFSGNESILYHLWSPCRVKDVGDFTIGRSLSGGAPRTPVGFVPQRDSVPERGLGSARQPQPPWLSTRRAPISDNP